MAPITVINVAHYKREFNNFHQIIENGFGPGIYTFVHFIQPAVVVIDGIEHLTDKNACIIYTPGQRQEYKHFKGVFLNGFLIFHTDDPYFIARYGLPENEIFYITGSDKPNDEDKIDFLLELVTYTITDKLINRASETNKHLLKFFETLSAQYIKVRPVQKRIFETKQRFIALRDEVQMNPRGWSVDKMAKKVWFTRSRFTVLYRDFFNISPGADLINIKIEHAKRLLETTDIPVAKVSAICGYAKAEHFIRIFSKQVKCTPLQYRKKYNQNRKPSDKQ